MLIQRQTEQGSVLTCNQAGCRYLSLWPWLVANRCIVDIGRGTKTKKFSGCGSQNEFPQFLYSSSICPLQNPFSCMSQLLTSRGQKTFKQADRQQTDRVSVEWQRQVFGGGDWASVCQQIKNENFIWKGNVRVGQLNSLACFKVPCGQIWRVTC